MGDVAGAVPLARAPRSLHSLCEATHNRHYSPPQLQLRPTPTEGRPPQLKLASLAPRRHPQRCWNKSGARRALEGGRRLAAAPRRGNSGPNRNCQPEREAGSGGQSTVAGQRLPAASERALAGYWLLTNQSQVGTVLEAPAGRISAQTAAKGSTGGGLHLRQQ